MINDTLSNRGMVTAPHHLAADAGRDVLRENGTAIEAMVTTAAVIAVVYPHMNAIGGDGFWLIAPPGQRPTGIDACGPAAAAAHRDTYRRQGMTDIPARGPAAALTVPGTIHGWATALRDPRSGSGRLPLSRLLAPAVELARRGVPVTRGQAELTAGKLEALQSLPGFEETFLGKNGNATVTGETLAQPRLADTLEQLGRAGLDDFYRGDVARSMAGDLAAVGSPIGLDDLETFKALEVTPLELTVDGARLFNMPPPTQGLASLMILGIFDRLGIENGETFEHLHGLVEATKQAFKLRDQTITDPRWMTPFKDHPLEAAQLAAAATAIDAQKAAPWPQPPTGGDTVWMGAVDSQGRTVSFIQSIYWEYGAGVVLPETGVLMQNRGMSFGLEADHPQALEPGRRPFHTLNPAMAIFDDGRHMAYGTMGGEGQPQTQAAVFSRYGFHGMPLQRAITAPRWLLGRTWGDATTSLKLESRVNEGVVSALKRAGHDVEVVGDYDSRMGHAGAIVMHPDGHQAGATDPRSDGHVAAV